jgi:proline iminopeptidase
MASALTKHTAGESPQSVLFHSVDMDIHCQVEGEGPVLICLHGGKGNSGDYFIPHLSPLADDMTMVYLDERGSGKSKRVPDKSRVSYEGMAADIENLIHHFGVEQAGILGHSFGGNLALYFALTRPDLVRELYIVAGGPARKEFRENLWPWFIDGPIEKMGLKEKLEAVGDRFNNGELSADESFRETVKAQIPLIFYHCKEKRDIILETFARTDYTVIGRGNASFDNEPEIIDDILHRLSEVSCPTLLVAGQHDLSTPLEFYGDMARGIDNAQLTVIPRSRHFPFIDEPEIFIAAIRSFRKAYNLDAGGTNRATP